jgi:hypothetical protein
LIYLDNSVSSRSLDLTSTKDKKLKVNTLETHDRLLHFNKTQSHNLSDCCQRLMDQRPFGDRPFYIFAHKREIGLDEKFSLYCSGVYKFIEDVPTHRMIWQPRLTKPKAQTNSMLFKGYPGTDMVKVIWIIPERELWDQYKKGKMTECKTIVESIDKFENDRAYLEKPDPDDPLEVEIDSIYQSISRDARAKAV